MKPANFERRSNTFTAEIRAEGDRPKIAGYAVIWDTLSEEMGGFREVIAPGAFTRTLSDKTIRRHAFWNHDSRLVLGSEENGTLLLRQDDKGLWFEATPAPTTFASDLLALMRAGDVRKCSFGFVCPAGGSRWRESPDGQVIRTVSEARLYEVSIVTEPAYTATSADVRCALDELAKYKRRKVAYMELRRRVLALRQR